MKRIIIQRLLIVFVVALLVGIAAIYYMFNMPGRNIANEKSAYALSAKQLMKSYADDETKANQSYLNKVLLVTGQVKTFRTLQNHSMVFNLEDELVGVSCQIDSVDAVKYSPILSTIQKGMIFTFKGRCTGSLMDVQMINCLPVKE